ncbi:Eisosome component PIL1/LSP1 [Abortiporus biennis]
MPSFFSSIADKAQNALNQTPLAGSSGFHGSRTLENLSHQLRTFQQQYSSSTTPVQKIITSGKGIAIDFDSLSHDAQAHSKELYLWGQAEKDDLKDVSDRLAWLNFVHGSLAHTLAEHINTSRAPFKALRAAEAQVAPRRAMRANLENQINKLENENKAGSHQRLGDLRVQLHKVEMDDENAEKEIELLKRKALAESESAKWAAIREYAEKVVLLSQAADAIIPELPSVPPTKEQPYTGAQATASVRASMQKALDQYRPNSLDLVLSKPTEAEVKRSDTRSFGETHANELSQIGAHGPEIQSSLPVTPPSQSSSGSYAPPAGPPPQHHAISSSQSLKAAPVNVSTSPSPPSHASSPPTHTPPLNPATLNQSPAPIPVDAQSKQSAVASPDPSDSSTNVPAVLPTVAETGVPKSAGPGGPGPATGSLLDLKAEGKKPQSQASPAPQSDLPGYNTEAPKWESAEEEKKRLEREERERILAYTQQSPGAGAPPATGTSPSVHEDTKPKQESAEEEKKRLEREEREKVLRDGGSGGPGGPPHHDGPDGDSDLPPYEEFTA